MASYLTTCFPNQEVFVQENNLQLQTKGVYRILGTGCPVFTVHTVPDREILSGSAMYCRQI